MNDITALAQNLKNRAELANRVGAKHPKFTADEVLVLVEALEKAHLEISSANRMMKAQDQELITRRQRIASLESRTVTVKLPAEYLNADGSVNADMANTCPVVSAYREAHRAAGIQVIEGEGQ